MSTRKRIFIWRSLLFLTAILLIQMSCSTFLAASYEVEQKTYFYNSNVNYTNRGNKSVELGDRIINIFLNTTWQTTYLLQVNQPYEKVFDADGNPAIRVYLPPVRPNEEIMLASSFMIVEKERKAPNISVDASGHLDDISDELRREYTGATGNWLTKDQILTDLAHQIQLSAGNTTNVLRTVLAMADWIGTHISPVKHDMPHYPNETYYSREGDCDDQSILLVTLCRILGIPAYLQIGALQSSGRGIGNKLEGHETYFLKYVVYHAWAIIYIPPWGWLPFDVTLGWTKLKSLSGITAAPVWYTYAVQMMNVTKSDWVGEVHREKDDAVTSSIYMHYENELINEDSGKSPGGANLFLARTGQVLALFVWIFLLVILLIFFFSIGYVTRMPDLEKETGVARIIRSEAIIYKNAENQDFGISLICGQCVD